MDGVGIGKAIRAVFILAIVGWTVIFIGAIVVGVHFLAKVW